MNMLDFSPLLHTAIGFDRLADVMGNLSRNVADTAYPPYNIKKIGEHAYELSMAIAGFGPEDLELTTQNNTLTISGRIVDQKEDKESEYLHKGIAQRAFERKFILADYMHVENATLNNGLLQISLKVVLPDTLKQRSIPISNVSAQQIEQKPIPTREGIDSNAEVAA